LTGAAPLQSVKTKAGSPPPVVKASNDFAYDPVSGKQVDSAPVVIPPDAKWNTPTKVVDANVLSRRAFGIKGQTAVVTSVLDGDGATMKLGDGSKVNCRIDMIDAPETPKNQTTPPKPGQPGGYESKKSLQEMIENKEVTVYVTSAPSEKNYGRAMCQVEIQGVNVSMEQIRRGQAYIYEKFVARELNPEAYALQDKAKADKTGVFAVLNAESPAAYRKRVDTR
jgi:endonuclease YncB( thermonuclease family)